MEIKCLTSQKLIETNTQRMLLGDHKDISKYKYKYQCVMLVWGHAVHMKLFELWKAFGVIS